MPVTGLLAAAWDHKVKVALIAIGVVFVPGLYESWQNSRAAEQLVSDRKAVDTDASVAGMMLASAWRSCSQIGIVNDMEGCARCQGRLLQEQTAPMAAKLALEQRDAFWRGCRRLYPQKYCGQVLQRAFQLSFAQGGRNE
jgi:hypothetical protein